MEDGSTNSEHFLIQCEKLDLSDTNAVEIKFPDLLMSLTGEFDHVLFFNNAGSIADVSKPILDYQWSIQDYTKYFNLSIISSIYMINAMIHKFSLHPSKIVIIQTSSLAAVQEMAYMPLYCAAKTSMDMFIKCVTKDHPNIKTLNYAPGPLDTAMGQDMKNKHGSDDTRQFFNHLFESRTIINPDDSAGKLMGLLEKMDFESGAHIDYYDV
ncbi:sepiapterin reductase-like [Clytia hemisphaerica]|uniref:sepiapterin reductase-like n=1 Tax=Clytia hemisphaerica TaxID=252671 RepID=UPI0034D5A877